MGNTNKIEIKREPNMSVVKLYNVSCVYSPQISDRYEDMIRPDLNGFQQNLDFTELYKVRCEVSETVSQYPKSRLYLEFPEIDYNRTEEEPFNGIELDINYLYPDIQMQFELEL
jgi:hypothetical protein